ncbi:uncharacterized protein LOC117477184 isoform X3 [Trematomus bernacchii]|uniref:uncharacterized protein LOC117477184 isoform X3 n=1 Tax=Trematomus bernacchii TaxID=40690 RepID=UPI00146C5E36|nr:uncharacterized protein LOC117477184 isoform X3 [Trematomus bernacchii]
MAEFKRIQMCSLLILLLQFTGAAIGQRPLFLSVRVGDEATLPCNSVRDDQDQCNGTTWFFRDSRGTAVLVEDGQIDEDAKAKSDRLRVTENCSLGIKKVTEEDAGGYGCRQFRSGEQRRGPGSYVYLSVVTMTEHQDNDEVTLNCSVVPYRRCDHRVKWLLQGRDVDKDHREIKTSQSPCSASVTFLSSLFSYTSRSELFTCEVTYRSNVWTFSPQSSGAAIGQRYLYLSVRVGDEATLPCNSVRDDQDQCNGTTWFFRDSGGTAVLVEDGQIDEDAKAKSDRLRVTENCSLGIKKVTEEDAGRYVCRQFRSGEQQRDPGSYVYLFVVTMTEHQDNDEVTLNCSVVPYRRCDHTVKWLLQGRDVDKDHRDIKTSQSTCSASVTFLTSLFSYTTRSELFTCEVTYRSNVWTFSPQSSGAAIGQRYLSVRVGDEATLPCNSVRDDQDQCNGTTWFFSGSGGTAVLVEDGQIDEDAKAKSDRLRVTENCSLGIKKVTEEDAGGYGCRQFRSGEQRRGPGSYVYLSVVTMTEHQDNDEVTLNCSVVPYRLCDEHTVKWLLLGRDVDKDHREINTSQSPCSASVTFLSSLFSYTTRSELFTCEVTYDYTGEGHQFPFSLQSSGEDTTTTATTTTTTTESDSRSGFTTTASVITEDSATLQGLLRHILVPVGLAALIMIVVVVSIWTRIKEKQTQMDEINVRYDVDDGTVNYENIRPPDGV